MRRAAPSLREPRSQICTLVSRRRSSQSTLAESDIVQGSPPEARGHGTASTRGGVSGHGTLLPYATIRLSCTLYQSEQYDYLIQTHALPLISTLRVAAKDTIDQGPGPYPGSQCLFTMMISSRSRKGVHSFHDIAQYSLTLHSKFSVRCGISKAARRICKRRTRGGRRADIGGTSGKHTRGAEYHVGARRLFH